MKFPDHTQCIDFSCSEVRQESFLVSDLELDPGSITVMLNSKTVPTEVTDYYYGSCEALFDRTTVQAFQETGLKIGSIQDLLRKGIYLTTAVKCGKYEYAVATSTIVHCSALLEREIDLFPNVKAYLLMDDVVIKAVNASARCGRCNSKC